MNASIIIGVPDEGLTEEQRNCLPLPPFYSDNGGKYWGHLFQTVGDDGSQVETVDVSKLTNAFLETGKEFARLGIPTVPEVYLIYECD